MQTTDNDPRRAPATLARLASAVRRRWIGRRYVHPAEALVAANRSEEAEALVAKGLALVPGDIDLLMTRARLAFRSGQPQLAVTRWREALANAPDRVECLVGLAGVLRVTGQLDQAAPLMATASALNPDDPAVIGESARHAEARGDFATALHLWRRLTSRPHPAPMWRGSEVQALMMLNRLDEAEAVLAEAEAALTTRPEEDFQARYLLVMRGRLISARRDWPAAVTFWTAFQKRFPQAQPGWQHLGRAVENLAYQHAEARPEGAHVPMEAMAAIEVVADAPAHDLLLEFDSMGTGCEFGLVQRRFGAEPLSLLRWNAAPMIALLAAFEHDLAGVGHPQNTMLFAQTNGEYFVQDRRWGLAMHTWLFVGQTDEAQLLEKMCRRLSFLRDKLLVDLTQADKIFIHHSEVIEAEPFARLHGLLRRHGAVRLLGVQPAYGRATPGEVVQVGEDRYIGFVERLGRRDDGSWDILFDDWLAVCRNAKALITASPGQASSSDLDTLGDT